LERARHLKRAESIFSSRFAVKKYKSAIIAKKVKELQYLALL